jgi:hypothetical protein
MAAAHSRYPLLAAPDGANHRKNYRLGCDKYKGEFYFIIIIIMLPIKP